MAFEDFTSYTEVDTESRLTVSTNQITFTGLEVDDSCYVYKDFGIAYFDKNFRHQFIGKFNEAGFAVVHLSMLAAQIGDAGDLNAAGDYVTVVVSNRIIYLSQRHAGASTSDNWTPSTYNIDYYFTLDRDYDGGVNGTGQYILSIKTGSHGGPTVQTLTIDSPAGGQIDYRYYYGINSADGFGGSGITGYSKEHFLGGVSIKQFHTQDKLIKNMVTDPARSMGQNSCY